jgi:hypothetical protein
VRRGGPAAGVEVASVRACRTLSTTRPVNAQEPLPRVVAARAVARCVLVTVRLLASRQTHLVEARVGQRLRFADATLARVFRETVVDHTPPEDPSLLVVEFRLRLLRGRWQRLFLWECILNTPLFVGFPGFVSKLWLDHDDLERYRGFYEWNDAAGAEFYARSLWRVLELVCRPGSIHYRVIPGLRRDEVLADPQLLAAISPDDGAAWWRVVAST